MKASVEGVRCLFLRDRMRWAAISILGIAIAFSGPAVAASPQSEGASEQSEVAAHFARAGELVREKNFQGAAKEYEQALKIDPDSFEALNNLGVIYALLGKYPEAANAYERALRVKPGSFPLWVNLGLAYFKGKEFSKAIAPFSHAVKIEPGNFQAEALLAMSYFWAKDFAAASSHLELLVRQRPDNQALEYLLARSFLESGQSQKLLALTSNAPPEAFQPLTLHVLRGEALEALNHTAQAIEEFKAAASLAPDQAGLHFALGYLYWKNHENQSAAAEFWREMEGGGLIAESETYLGDIALKEGKKKEARAFLQQALSLYPKTALASYDFALLDAEAKHYSAAIAGLTAAAQIDPALPGVHDELAHVYRAQGRLQLAAAEMKLAAEKPGGARRRLFQMIPASLPESN